ncbi:hypothetical protein [Nannocystis punicea]|uniref:J domain-containing protein n=1 Tax=Nannocystis punicea TaxID=2995304 RepID=A0ABY7GVA4_9BACT|nr:hypothetical protein [Nannocystis poenicansa]WAS90899.1 hypothetical protein O0S08_32320 [Nannocystis poenicansa]
MSAATSALSLLLALQQAAPATCPTGDNRCKAELFVRRAKDEATPPEHRAKYLLAAHRLYLGLYDKTGDDRDLCAARRSFEQLRKAHADAQPASLAEALTELRTREQLRKPRCSAERETRPTTSKPRVARVSPPPRSEPTRATPVEPPALQASAAGVRGEDDLLPPLDANTRRRPEPPFAEPVRPPPDAAPRPGREAPVLALVPTVPGQDAAQVVPGRRLAIAGGLTLGAGLVLGGVAAYAAAKMVDARNDGFTFQDTPVDADDAAAFDRDTELRADYQSKANMTLGTALAGGAALVVAAVLLGVGARRLARKSSQAALLPVPGGLVLRARF